MSDDTHDIRYLHDKNIPDDSIIKDDDSGNILSPGKIAIIIGFVALTGIGMVFIFQATNKTTEEKQPEIVRSEADTKAEPTAIPTITQTKIQGTVICLGESEASADSPECGLGIQAKTGEVYALENVQFEDIASGQLAVGSTVSVTGTTQTTGTSSNGQSQTASQPTTVYVETVTDPPPGSVPTATPLPPTPTDVPPEQD